MLCPQCHKQAPGGSICDSCGHPVPERESFGGQGAHYLLVFAALSLLLFVMLVVIASQGIGIVGALRRITEDTWLVIYAMIILAPLALGFYYWALLREEEVSVTDDSIVRHSYWGDQTLYWKDVVAFERHPILFSETQLGRIAGLSRVLRGRKIIAKLPTVCYELRTLSQGVEAAQPLCLEPGAIDDLPWLIDIITERIGPPIDV